MINDPVPLRLHWITGMFTFTETEVRKEMQVRRSFLQLPFGWLVMIS